MLTTNTSKLCVSVLAALSMSLGACASKIDKADISPTANPAEEIPKLEQEMKQAADNHADILAPKDYSKAGKYYDDAKEAYADKEDQSKVVEKIAYSTAYLNRAQTKTQERSEQIQDILDARSAAITAGARNHKDQHKTLAKLDKEISKASDDLQDDLKPDDLARLQRDYMALEVSTIQANALSESRAIVSGSKESKKAEKRAPQTLKRAEVDLRNAENVIAQNAKNPGAYSSEVAKANASAKLLEDVLNAMDKNGKETTEPVALQLVQQNRQITNLESNLGEAQTSLNAMGQTVAQQGQILSLQQALEEARKQFKPEEAEVFQQGNQLLIRLKTMNFSVGRSELPQESLDILAKVNEVVAALPATKITVEGHTDSSGSAKVNNKLSQERAEAVAKYMSSNGIETDVDAVGYGFQKPIASNKSKEGRAQNRRVDVVVTASGSSQQEKRSSATSL